MDVFHYSSLDNWYDIKHGSYVSQDQPGLGANKRMGQHYRPAFETCAVFCLTDPKPDSWTKSTEFNEAWNALMRYVGNVLLRVDITGIEDQAKVVDWGYREAFHQDMTTGPYASKTIIEAEEKYFTSAIDLAEYVADPRLQKTYYLPEVIITQHVPLERISFAPDQSKLVASVRQWRGEWREGFEHKIRSIPELSAVYEDTIATITVPV